MQFSLRLKDPEKLRVDALIGSLGATRYEVVKRVFLLGLERVERGDEPADPIGRARRDRRIDGLIALLEREFQAGRARDFNLAADNLEAMVWLRTLGEILAPNSLASVTKRIQFGRESFLSTLEELPPDAPAKRFTENP